MPALALALLILSASMHTAWNLLIKQARHKFIASWWTVFIGGIIAVVGLFFTGLPIREVWILVIISSGLEAAYLVTLSYAYRDSDFSLVYPMARGTAPAFLLIWSLIFLQEKITTAGFLGLGLIITGLLINGISSLIRNWTNVPSLKGIAAALATAFLISVYTLIDGIAVRQGSALPYGLVLFTLIPMWASPFVLKRYGWRRLVEEWNVQPARFLTTGILGMAAYSMALFAYSIAPISYSGAIREVSVVLGALAGWYFLKEKLGPKRIVGALIIFAGILTIAMFG